MKTFTVIYLDLSDRSTNRLNRETLVSKHAKIQASTAELALFNFINHPSRVGRDDEFVCAIVDGDVPVYYTGGETE